MPTYVTLYRFTDQGVRDVGNSPGRIQAAKQAAAAAGGKVLGVYVTMGPYDLVAISEWPSDEMVASAALSLASQGNSTTCTMRAFTETEFGKIVAGMPKP
jgi:uncharacterized protein with GYD domain